MIHMINYIFSNPIMGAKFGITTPDNKKFVYRFRYVSKLNMWSAHRVLTTRSVYLGRVNRIPALEVQLTRKSSQKLSDLPVALLNATLYDLDHNIALPKGYSIYRK